MKTKDQEYEQVHRRLQTRYHARVHKLHMKYDDAKNVLWMNYVKDIEDAKKRIFQQ